MITSIHGDIIATAHRDGLNVVRTQAPTGDLWCAYDPDRPFGMKTGATATEAVAKWHAAHPVRLAA